MTDLIREEISQFIRDEGEIFKAKYIHFAVIDEVMEKNGFTWTESDFNGWQHDCWVTYSHPDKEYVYQVEGSWYYPDVTIEKKYE